MTETAGAGGAGDAGDGSPPPGTPGDVPIGIDIGGDATGPVVAGHHNVVVDAHHGSQVHVVVGAERPRPRRRERISLLPRHAPAPLGREREARQIAAAVAAGGPAQLWGPPGVGKSTLLRHLARELPPGRDGVVFLSASRREVVDLAQELFEACYEAPGYAPSRTELRRLLADLRVAVYVDDADLPADQLRELMDVAPAATFVLTGAERSLWGAGTTLPLDGLPDAAAVELLTGELGRALAEEERPAALALCRAASGLPLPLLRAAAVAGAAPPRAGRLPLPGEVAALLPAVLDQLVADTAAMAALHLLATLDGVEVPTGHIGALTDTEDAAEVCERLVRLGLVRADERGYTAAADAVPALRRRFAAPFPAERLCDHFVRWASLTATTPAELAEAGPVLEKAAELAASTGRADVAVRLARATSPGLARSLRLGAWGRLLGRGWVAARVTGDRRAEAYFLHEEGIRALVLGRRAVHAALLAQSAWLGYELGDGGQGAAGGASEAPDGSASGAPEGADPPDGVDPGSPDTSASAGDPSLGSPDSAGPLEPSATGPLEPSATGAPDLSTSGAGAGPGQAPPDFDVERYMAENGYGFADAAPPGGPGTAPDSPEASDGVWGEPTPESADASGAPWGDASATSDGGSAASSGAVAAPSGTAAGAAGAGGLSAAAVSLVSLVVGCALVLGLGYTFRAATSDDERPPTENAVADDLPTPTFTLPDLPEEPAEDTEEFDLSNPPGCDERGAAKSASSERMIEAPITNPGHDEAWASTNRLLAEDLAAAAEVATDPAISAALQEESAAHAALADAIEQQVSGEQAIQDIYDAGGVVIDLCY